MLPGSMFIQFIRQRTSTHASSQTSFYEWSWPGVLRHATSSHVFPISHISICCNAGNRTSQALLGLQLSPDQQEAFQAVIQELEVDFTFTTLPEDARRVFDMFIQ